LFRPDNQGNILTGPNHLDMIIATSARVLGPLRRDTLHENELGFIVFDEEDELVLRNTVASHPTPATPHLELHRKKLEHERHRPDGRS
ncbi:hypothetical protein PHISCL_10480, partial [Aspergillus sclerotialis]